MRYRQKVRQFERQLNYQEEGTDLRELLKKDYKYKGEPFNSLDEMIKGMNVTEIPPDVSAEEIIRLFENKLLSYESPEMQNILAITLEQMEAKL